MARQILTRFDPDKKKLLFYDEKSARVRRALMFSLFVSAVFQLSHIVWYVLGVSLIILYLNT